MEVNSRIESEPSYNILLSSSSQRNRLRQHRDSLAAVERDVAEVEQRDDPGDITTHDQQLDEQLLVVVVEVQDDGSTARHLINQSTSDENENEDTGGNDANNRSLARQQKQKHKGNAPGVNKQTRNGRGKLENNKPINNNRKQSTHHRGANQKQKTRAANNNTGKVRQQKNQNNHHQKPVGRKNNNNNNRHQQMNRNGNDRGGGRNGGTKNNKIKTRNGDVNIGSNNEIKQASASDIMIPNYSSGKPYIQQVSTSWNGPPPPRGWMEPQWGWPGPWQSPQAVEAWESPEWYVASSGKSSKASESSEWYGKSGKGGKSSKFDWDNSGWNDIWNKPWNPSGKPLGGNNPPVWQAPPDWKSLGWRSDGSKSNKSSKGGWDLDWDGGSDWKGAWDWQPGWDMPRPWKPAWESQHHNGWGHRE